MKCKCGGNLKRIAVDCYQCEECEIKQKIAFIKSTVSDTYTSDINTIGYKDRKHNDITDVIEKIEKEIYEKLGIKENLMRR